MSRTVRFNDQPEASATTDQNGEATAAELVADEKKNNAVESGFRLLRENCKYIKPYSKYTEEGVRPRSPNTLYSKLSADLIKKIPTDSDAVFLQTRDGQENRNDGKRFTNDRHTETFNEHVIRGKSASIPYGWITKDAFSHHLPPEYTSSANRAYPPWGPDQVGFRTRSHYVAEPAEKFANIDMYKRPLTNQPGRIIFDYGRPNNGYYLQRQQYDNTWFKAGLTLNKTDILKSVAPKTRVEYDHVKQRQHNLVRSKSAAWPYHSEYTGKFALSSKE